MSVIAFISDNAIAINALCDSLQVDASLRERCHRLHGEMIARGCSEPAEIMRIVRSKLEREIGQTAMAQGE